MSYRDGKMPKEKKDQIVKLLEEILKWIKFQGWRNVKGILLDTLKDDLSKLVYHYSDGRSSREVADKVPIDHVTVTKYWKKWRKIGIVEPMHVRRGTRYKRIFSLEEFGIEIPKLSKQHDQNKEGKKNE